MGSAGAPRPRWAKEGAWLPLSKHRGVMWSFNSGTGGLGQVPGLTRCVCVWVCRVRVGERKFKGGQEGTRNRGLWGLCKGPRVTGTALPACQTWLLPLLGQVGMGCRTTPCGPRVLRLGGRAAGWLAPDAPAVVCPAPEGHRFEVLACSFGNGKERGRTGKRTRRRESRQRWHETGSGMLLLGRLCRRCLCLRSLRLLRRGLRFGEIHLQDVPL